MVGVRRRHGDWLELVQDVTVGCCEEKKRGEGKAPLLLIVGLLCGDVIVNSWFLELIVNSCFSLCGEVLVNSCFSKMW